MKVKSRCGNYCIAVDEMEGSKQARCSRKGRQAVCRNGNRRKSDRFLMNAKS